MENYIVRLTTLLLLLSFRSMICSPTSNHSPPRRSYKNWNLSQFMTHLVSSKPSSAVSADSLVPKLNNLPLSSSRSFNFTDFYPHCQLCYYYQRTSYPVHTNTNIRPKLDSCALKQHSGSCLRSLCLQELV